MGLRHTGAAAEHREFFLLPGAERVLDLGGELAALDKVRREGGAETRIKAYYYGNETPPADPQCVALGSLCRTPPLAPYGPAPRWRGR